MPVDFASGSMLPRPFRVVGRRADTRDTVTLWLEPEHGPPLRFAPGQFTMLYAFGVGEVPISISGDPGDPARLQHTIRDVGGVTATLVNAEPGDVLGVRGPFGASWEVSAATGGDLLVVAGGIGLAPLRPAVLQALARRRSYGRVVLLYGARGPDELLYPDELDQWAGGDVEVLVAVDHATGGYNGRVGLVTDLLGRVGLDPVATTAMVCGPEVMMRRVADALSRLGVRPDRIRLSLERSMQCGVGLCGHCQLREFFVCTDGPVFAWEQVGGLMAVAEL